MVGLGNLRGLFQPMILWESFLFPWVQQRFLVRAKGSLQSGAVSPSRDKDRSVELLAPAGKPGCPDAFTHIFCLLREENR